MLAITASWDPQSGWSHDLGGSRDHDGGNGRTLALVFSETDEAVARTAIAQLEAALPTAVVVGCSTSGLIQDARVSAAPVVAAVVNFDRIRPTVAWTVVGPGSDSRQAGERIGSELAGILSADEPATVFVLADGVIVNGTDLVSGLEQALPPRVAISGGLAGDGSRFADTWVYAEGALRRGAVAAVALHGHGLVVGHGSAGGWQGFGPFRQVTRSEGNVLHTLDDRPALALYREYLGERAEQLPASALLFPLQIRSPDGETEVVRTVLGIDESTSSMTFAGDIPEGWTARLMRTTLDALIDAASLAAEAACDTDAELVLAVSCVGRRLVLGQRTEEEVEAALDVLGTATPAIGFYSYGEISPGPSSCELHNQTMTITTIGEIS